MAAGDILKEALLVVEEFTVKENEDIELGELCYDDGNGILAATAAGAVASRVVMAIEAHTYADESTHKIKCVVVGCVTVQKKTGTAIVKNDKVCVSSTAGEVTKFVKGDAPTGGVSTYYTTTIESGVQTALDTNLAIVGTAIAAAASGDTTANIWLGVY